MSLLAIDIGNSNTVIGVFEGLRLGCHWRISTDPRRTEDELLVLVRQLLATKDVRPDTLEEAIIASVVPPALPAFEAVCERGLGIRVLAVGPGMKTGMPILCENPREVGADRIVNAVAAYEEIKSGCIVVDFGTATTWDVVTPKGEYLGGAIAPGVQISAEALYQRASKLPRVEVARPQSAIGRNTTSSMQAGLFYGYVGMIDGMVERIAKEVDFDTRCIATGGLAKLLADESKGIESVDELLTLRGLRILAERNR